ncbi:MAG: hypothetical protein ACK5MA_09055 [Parachlamydiaceae bacterium]
MRWFFHFCFIVFIPLLDLHSHLSLLPASVAIDESGSAILRWNSPEDDLDFSIYAIDESGERYFCTSSQKTSYLIEADFKAFEVEVLKEGAPIASSGVLLNPNYTAGYPDFTKEEWFQITPYLLPNTHPSKESLDRLFQSDRFTNSYKTLRKKGFEPKGPGSKGAIVVKHKDLPGILVKFFSDDRQINELNQFLKRINGAHIAKEIIAKYKLEWILKVPNKWLYILPREPLSTGAYPKNLVLIVEDMELVTREENELQWKSDDMTKAKLDAIYILLKIGGFIDLILPINLSFSKDGRLAVVDTEDYHRWPIPYKRLSKHLSKEMTRYWNELIRNDGPAEMNSE